jgi:hypothetical protein
MKFSAEHYNSLKDAIQKAFDRLGMYSSQWRVKYQDLSETRMLWDMYWLSGWSQANRAAADCYLDAHITSALRKILKEI